MELFKPIAPVRAYQVVINQLEETILSGRLTPGDKLPPERELIESLGTSRRTLREAFRVLEQKGLLEIKIGSKGGTFVADRIQERLSETLGMLMRTEKWTKSWLLKQMLTVLPPCSNGIPWISSGSSIWRWPCTNAW
ncbi:MAG: FadR family transcriptional regulator [Deltaproteobacteria bacterium]|nr:FadR family transcriptional regulator [Deltaproteobacteria bacterium]